MVSHKMYSFYWATLYDSLHIGSTTFSEQCMADQEIVGGDVVVWPEARGWGVGRGYLPTGGEVWGGGCAPEIIFILDLKMASLGALWVPVWGCIPIPLWIRHCLGVSEFF